MVDDPGPSTNDDCTLCHSLMAYESATPFRFLQPLDPMAPEQEMHRYLQWEFVGDPPPSAAPDGSAPPTLIPEPAED